MAHPLGSYIALEVSRAESDFSGARRRGQAVLTVSGGLVAALGAVLAFGLDAEGVTLTSFGRAALAVALCAFTGATIFVLMLFMPSATRGLAAGQLQRRVDEEWHDSGWDQTVAEAETRYLVSLRAANIKLNNLLLASIVSQVLGIAAVGVMLLSLLASAA